MECELGIQGATGCDAEDAAVGLFDKTARQRARRDPQDRAQPAGASAPLRASADRRAGARQVALSRARQPAGQGVLPVELRRGADPHHAPPVHRGRARRRDRTAPRDLPGRDDRGRRSRSLPEPPLGHVPDHDARRAHAAADRPGALDPFPRGAHQPAARSVRHAGRGGQHGCGCLRRPARPDAGDGLAAGAACAQPWRGSPRDPRRGPARARH